MAGATPAGRPLRSVVIWRRGGWDRIPGGGAPNIPLFGAAPGNALDEVIFRFAGQANRKGGKP